ncbi:MAG TPA: H-X9-DG-CTERM domain-containing protein [Chthoniobacteraceae bacterium]|nr:H-X9-DG-CTERM domain-containing protein [Chthoniobacteraceae bacterium]
MFKSATQSSPRKNALLSPGIGSGGFTVTELLVVVALLSVLTVLAFTAIPGIAQRRHHVKCVANLKLLGQAVLTHAVDHNGRSVVAYLNAERSPTGKASLWYTALESEGYLNKGQHRACLTCPAAAPWSYSDKGSNNMYTYGLRRWDGERTYTSAWVATAVTHPSRFVLLADSYKASSRTQFYYISWPGFTSSAPEQFHLRHHGKANLFFGDGSVRSLDGPEILALDDGWKASVIFTPSSSNP